MKNKDDDVNIIATQIVSKTTESPKEFKKAKNPAAVTLGHLGGLKGGKARAAKLTPKRRKAIAKKAAEARWASKHKP